MQPSRNGPSRLDHQDAQHGLWAAVADPGIVKCWSWILYVQLLLEWDSCLQGLSFLAQWTMLIRSHLNLYAQVQALASVQTFGLGVEIRMTQQTRRTQTLVEKMHHVLLHCPQP